MSSKQLHNLHSNRSAKGGFDATMRSGLASLRFQTPPMRLLALAVFLAGPSLLYAQLQFTKLIDNTTARPDSATSGYPTFGPYAPLDYSNQLGFTTPVTDGKTVGFNVGYYTYGNSGLNGCSSTKENSIWTIPINGGTPSIVAGWSINLEPMQPSTSSTTTCNPIYVGGGKLYFYGTYQTAQTARQGIFAVPLAGGANAEVVAAGDVVNGIQISSTTPNGSTGGNYFLSNISLPAGYAGVFATSPAGSTAVYTTQIVCNGASLYINGSPVTDGTLFADSASLGPKQVIVSSTGTFTPACSNIVLSIPQGETIPTVTLPGLVGTAYGDPVIRQVAVISGNIYIQANEALTDGTAYSGIFKVSGGALVKIIGSNDTFPGMSLQTVQCRGYSAGYTSLPEFTGAGNWLITRVIGYTGANCTTNIYTSIQGIEAYNLDTNVISKVVVTGDVIDSAGDFVGSVVAAGGIHPGQVAADGHAVFTFAIGNTKTSSPYYGGAYALYSTNLNVLATQTTLTATPPTQSYFNNVTLSAKVVLQAGGTAIPTGSLQFLDGSTLLSTQVLDTSGNALLTLDGLSAGTHSITAVYGGDQTYSASTSSAASVSVTQGTTSLALSTSNSNILVGATATFTTKLSVTSAGGVPTGSIKFSDGSTSLGSAQVDNSGAAILQVSSLVAGTHTISASYAGDQNFTGSAAASLTETVTIPIIKAASSIALTLSAQSTPVGQSVTMTARATSASGVPTGNVVFLDGTTALGTATLNAQGLATFSVSTLAVGTHLLSVSYAGDANFTGSQSGTSTETIGTTDYTITATPASVTIKAGQSAQFTFLLTSLFGYNQPVALSCTNLPIGAACVFSPSTATPTATGASASLTITTTTASAALSPLKLWEGTTGTVLACCFLFGLRKRRIAFRLAALLVLVCGMGLAGCGNSPSSTSTPAATPTPAGTNAITVNASAGSGTTNHTAQITVIVTP